MKRGRGESGGEGQRKRKLRAPAVEGKGSSAGAPPCPFPSLESTWVCTQAPRARGGGVHPWSSPILLFCFFLKAKVPWALREADLIDSGSQGSE